MLFPEISPFRTHLLPVGNGHTLYVEESGNPHGIPVLNLHGGPGGGSKPSHRQRFDPKLYHIITFDQRGCGKSTFTHRLKANTTQHLLADIEAIRALLGVENWVLSGTSWGTSLALAYAQAHPQRVRGMILSAVFFATRHELEWWTNPLCLPRFYPDAYADLLETLGRPAWKQLPDVLFKTLIGRNRVKAEAAARAWYIYEGMGSVTPPVREEIMAYVNGKTGMAELAALEMHYVTNDYFLKPHQLMRGMKKIAHLPTLILQGGVDFCTPPETALRLHHALPNSKLTMIPLCGHVANAEMESARAAASNELISLL